MAIKRKRKSGEMILRATKNNKPLFHGVMFNERNQLQGWYYSDKLVHITGYCNNKSEKGWQTLYFQVVPGQLCNPMPLLMLSRERTHMKPGYKTTEFWLTLVANAISLLFASGLVCTTHDSQLQATICHVAGMVGMVLSTFGYQISRGLAKTNDPHVEPFDPTKSGS